MEHHPSCSWRKLLISLVSLKKCPVTRKGRSSTLTSALDYWRSNVEIVCEMPQNVSGPESSWQAVGLLLTSALHSSFKVLCIARAFFAIFVDSCDALKSLLWCYNFNLLLKLYTFYNVLINWFTPSFYVYKFWNVDISKQR